MSKEFSSAVKRLGGGRRARVLLKSFLRVPHKKDREKIKETQKENGENDSMKKVGNEGGGGGVPWAGSVGIRSPCWLFSFYAF